MPNTLKLLAGTLLLLAQGLVRIEAQDTLPILITPAVSRTARPAPERNFSGAAQVQPLFNATASTRATGATVAFAAGARTAWHTHPRGQTLIVTDGVGRVQSWGTAAREIRVGDVIWIPPGVKHWHGAAPTTAMTHIAIVESLDGQAVEWFGKVSDTEYGAPIQKPEGLSPEKKFL